MVDLYEWNPQQFPLCQKTKNVLNEKVLAAKDNLSVADVALVAGCYGSSWISADGQRLSFFALGSQTRNAARYGNRPLRALRPLRVSVLKPVSLREFLHSTTMNPVCPQDLLPHSLSLGLESKSPHQRLCLGLGLDACDFFREQGQCLIRAHRPRLSLSWHMLPKDL